MFGKLNHLAITTDHYTTLGMFYRAVFGMTVSGDTSREMSAISVGDGYTGMTLIPRRRSCFSSSVETSSSSMGRTRGSISIRVTLVPKE